VNRTHGALGAHLVADEDQLHRLRTVAAGEQPGDLIIRNGLVASFPTMEWLPYDVVVADGRIAAVTPAGHLTAFEELDADGLHVVPNHIDAHLHIEYTMLTPGQLARLSVPRGTTTVLADPNSAAAVLGTDGMDYMGATSTPLRIFQQVSPKIPSVPGMELAGHRIPQSDVLDRLEWVCSATLGEASPFSLDRAAAERFRTAAATGRRVTGHTARLGGSVLWSYAAAGVGDDHNAATTEEVIERLRLGMVVTIMAGSMNDNTGPIFSDLTAIASGFDRLCFCADDKHCLDLAEEGHIDHHVRRAIELGVDPLWAYRMASYNAAQHYRLDHLLGAVAPSRLADLQLIGDLAAARPSLVLVGGKTVAVNGVARFDDRDRPPPAMQRTIRLHSSLRSASFAVPAPAGEEGAWVQAVEMYDGYFKRAFHTYLHAQDGVLKADPSSDTLKIAVVDRHHATRAVGVGFVRGFGLQRGALATSTNCTNQNVVVVGVTDEDMAAACLRIAELGGGQVLVADGAVVSEVPLPVGGIMSDRPYEQVVEALRGTEEAGAQLGIKVPSPFMTLSFVGLAGVPDFGLTELGLIETATQTFAPVVLPVVGGRPACRCPSHRDDIALVLATPTA